MFDFRFGFYVKTHPLGQSLRSEIDHPAKNTRTIMLYEHWLLAFARIPGRFRKVREVGRNHVHVSWYLSDPVVSSFVVVFCWAFM